MQLFNRLVCVYSRKDNSMPKDVNDLSVEEVLELYSTMVYRLAFARTCNKADAEDITQEVFLKYMKNKKEYKDYEHLKAWFLTVTSNTCKNLFSSAWNQKTEGIADRDIPVEMEADEGSDVATAIAKLPDNYREVIHLFYYEELSIDEISRVIDTKVSTIKSLLHRGRKKLRSILEEGEDYV